MDRFPAGRPGLGRTARSLAASAQGALTPPAARLPASRVARPRAGRARPAPLRAAVAPFRVVSDVRASASFPHGMRIRVIEQPPVATLAAAGARTAVAADGIVLGPALLSGGLPALSASSAPAPGQRLSR